MRQSKNINYLPILFTIGIISCQSCINTKPAFSDDISSNEVTIDSSYPHDAFCEYFYSKDTLNDTLRFNFGDRADFGPVYLSEDELKQIYCEIKRGNTDAYNILCTHYAYSYSQYIPRSEMDKLICVTDFLGQEYSYYKGYLTLGNYFFDYLKSNVDDYYAAKMIAYYEKYFEFSQSKSIAIKLHEIYCGKYSFHDKDSVKAKYYEGIIIGK